MPRKTIGTQSEPGCVTGSAVLQISLSSGPADDPTTRGTRPSRVAHAKKRVEVLYPTRDPPNAATVARARDVRPF
eukprot:5979126-Pyramimonas_sp.AAC.1